MRSKTTADEAVVVGCGARFPRLSWLESVKPERLIVGPPPSASPAPFATGGVVGVEGGMARDSTGTKPGMPPNAPGKVTVGVAIGSTSVLVSELAEPGRGASDVDEDTSELSELGRGASVDVDEEVAELSEVEREGVADVDEATDEPSVLDREAVDVDEETDELSDSVALASGALVVAELVWSVSDDDESDREVDDEASEELEGGTSSD